MFPEINKDHQESQQHLFNTKDGHILDELLYFHEGPDPLDCEPRPRDASFNSIFSE